MQLGPMSPGLDVLSLTWVVTVDLDELVMVLVPRLEDLSVLKTRTVSASLELLE